MRRLSSLVRTGTRPARVVEEAEVKVGMPRRVSSRVPVAGAVRGVTGAAAGWGSVVSGGGAAVVLRRRGVEGMDENRVRPDRSWRAMECGILTQLVSYGRPTVLEGGTRDDARSSKRGAGKIRQRRAAWESPRGG